MELLDLDEIMLKNGLKTEPGQSPLLTKFCGVAWGWVRPEVSDGGDSAVLLLLPKPCLWEGSMGQGKEGLQQRCSSPDVSALALTFYLFNLKVSSKADWGTGVPASPSLRER